MNGVWYRFDDAVVHEVTLKASYNVNLVIYHRNDQPMYQAPADLSAVPRLGRTVVLNRKMSTDSPTNHGSSTSNVSGRPPLITPKVASRGSAVNSMPLKPEHPTRTQPPRHRKDYTMYYDINSASSEEENSIDKMHPDTGYTPEKAKGK